VRHGFRVLQQLHQLRDDQVMALWRRSGVNFIGGF
jgi:hypothetical protein